MPNIPILAVDTPGWHNHLIIGLLAASIILWIVWLIKVFINRDLLADTPEMTDRPQFTELGLALILMVLLTALFAHLLRGVLDAKSIELALAGALANLLTCLIVLAVISWPRPRRLAALGLTSKGWLQHLAWGSLAGLAVWPLATILLAPVSLHLVQFLSRWVWDLSYTTQEHSLLQQISANPSLLQSFLVIVLAIIVAPLVEEIIFRGLLQGALVRALKSRWLAICLTAAAFSVVHLTVRENPPIGQAAMAQIENMPPYFLLGLALGYAYEKSRSLYRPIALHLIFNALSIFFFWLNLD